MSFSSRLALALAIVVLDFVAFALPLTAILLAWVILARPAVFLQWVLRLYDDEEPPPRR